MEEEMFATPPISGEKVPFKDLPEEFKPVPQSTEAAKITHHEDKKIKSLKTWIIILGVGMVVIIIILLLLLLQISQKSGGTVGVQATPSPTPTAGIDQTVLPQEFIDQIETLNKDVRQVDLQELDLTYPQLDWDIKY